MNELFSQLASPFPPEDIEWRAGATNHDKTKALALAYITSRAVMDRLDKCAGPENWKDEYRPGPNGGVVCGLSLRIGEEWITKWDGADNSDIEGVKGGLSDAFKRAGYKWGIGRYLYGLEGQWVACEAHGKSIRLTSTPTLPKWALPNGQNTHQKTKSQATQSPAGSPTTHENGQQAQLPPFSLLALVEVGLFENTAAAAQIFNRSPYVKNSKAPDAEKWQWHRIYRAWREMEKSTDEAIEKANAGEIPAQER